MFIRFLLITFIFLTSCEKETKTEIIRPVKAIQVQPASSLESSLVFPGILQALNRADLSFRVDGIVVKRDIVVGSKAKRGEILIQLDQREYEIALQKAKGKVESIQAQLNFAIRDYSRMKNIYQKDPGAISENFLDRKKETQNQLEAELSIATSDYDKALDDLSYTSLRAPFDGIVVAIYVENYEQVRAKQSVLRLLDLNEREMTINVPERYVNALIEGRQHLSFSILLDAFPEKVFPATIKEIGTEASSTTQTYPVTLALNNIPTELSLLAGMNGKAILQQNGSPQDLKESTFTIPKSAIFSDNLNNTAVWIVDIDSQTVRKQNVKLLEDQRSDHAIVKEGLSNGDWVVTAGTGFLLEGQKVKLLPEQTKP